jgi:hypothetical protein
LYTKRVSSFFSMAFTISVLDSDSNCAGVNCYTVGTRCTRGLRVLLQKKNKEQHAGRGAGFASLISTGCKHDTRVAAAPPNCQDRNKEAVVVVLLKIKTYNITYNITLRTTGTA